MQILQLDRLQQYAREWRLTIEDSFETESSVISRVSRAGESLILKIVKSPGDEWNAGPVVEAFDGKGMVRVFEHTGGAMLLERLQPGMSLSRIEDDREATSILTSVMKDMAPGETPAETPKVEDWGKGFARYLASPDEQVPRQLVRSAQQVFGDLGASQRNVRLLHGDLHHYNVLLDENRGWVAIDPKGVVGEWEYEIGAVLRNPIEQPEQFLSRPIIERRLRPFVDALKLDGERIVAWAFAQAVLSAVWGVEDGHEIRQSNPALRLAEIMQPMVSRRVTI